MLDEFSSDARRRMESALEHTRHELAQIRTGRATPALLDSVKVPYYGAPTPLRTLASVTAPEARLLVVQPYDKNLMYDVARAIQASDLGLNPASDGTAIHVPIPPLTEERRHELVRLVHHLVEQGRIAIRNVRKDNNNHIRALEQTHEISENESEYARNEIQRITDEFIEKMNKLLALKEKEIMEE